MGGGALAVAAPEPDPHGRGDRSEQPNAALFSNIGGDVSAPGIDIASTMFGGTYGLSSGTSMAAPFVAGLAGFIASYKPSLGVDDIRAAIIAGARQDTTDGAAARIDAYSTVVRVPGAVHDLADWNDPSADGNRRIVRGRETGRKYWIPRWRTRRPARRCTPRPTVTSTCATSGDSATNLEVCQQGVAIAGCPAGAITLDGPDDAPKKDLNFDGCVTGTGSCRAGGNLVAIRLER